MCVLGGEILASSCHSIAGVFTQIPWLAASLESLESLESSPESFLNSARAPLGSSSGSAPLRSNSRSSSESYSGSSSESYPGSNSTRTPARTPESFFESYASPHQAGCQAPRPGHPSAVLRSSESSPPATSWTVVGGSDISYLPTSLPPVGPPGSWSDLLPATAYNSQPLFLQTLMTPGHDTRRNISVRKKGGRVGILPHLLATRPALANPTETASVGAAGAPAASRLRRPPGKCTCISIIHQFH